MKWFSTPAFLFILIFVSCRDEYRPEIITSPHAYLVVEGVMNVGNRSTTIRLSRTFMLDDSARLKFETGADVKVESRQGLTEILTMREPGVYVSENLHLQMDQEYRLHIRTENGDEFESDYVKPQRAGAIDSIGWKLAGPGLIVYVNSNNTTDASRYYMWEYGETFEIASYYFASLIYDESIFSVRWRRLPQEQVYQCWKTDSSKQIWLGSTAKLSGNTLFEAPVAVFTRGDEKLTVRYSMLLRQYGLTEKAYEYLSLMKKNTEDIGTIFDPQPSDIRGNIRCINRPLEPVIGFAMASTVEERRKFISQREIGSWIYPQYCPPDTVELEDVVLLFHDGGLMPYNEVYDEADPTILKGYLSSYPVCVDCRSRKGSLQRPSFW